MKPRVAVVGAGAFGGWTALHLVRRGARVTLIDAWGPGNSRASSGGETRIIRATYGPDRVYVDMVARSLQLWREFQERAGRPLFRKIGVLWLAGQDDRYERAALPLLREAGLDVEELTRAAAAARYPQINFER
ncbi:MAG TPA: FAD-dependent oxidoreductase, partial [Candidatus Dormibacteraeota bacterium]|nr:FAD-dependent oxidoreductase [Candidatus Dormibacteraeota bacterium]